MKDYTAGCAKHYGEVDKELPWHMSFSRCIFMPRTTRLVRMLVKDFFTELPSMLPPLGFKCHLNVPILEPGNIVLATMTTKMRMASWLWLQTRLLNILNLIWVWKMRRTMKMLTSRTKKMT